VAEFKVAGISKLLYINNREAITNSKGGQK
jgi:hypothetical protein